MEDFTIKATDFFYSLLDMIISPIIELFSRFGLSSVLDKSIKIGFGTIEWFDFTFGEVLHTVFIFILVIGFWRIIYRFWVWLYHKLIGGWGL